jgi:hypothetical protein
VRRHLLAQPTGDSAGVTLVKMTERPRISVRDSGEQSHVVHGRIIGDRVRMQIVRRTLGHHHYPVAALVGLVHGIMRPLIARQSARRDATF